MPPVFAASAFPFVSSLVVAIIASLNWYGSLVQWHNHSSATISDKSSLGETWLHVIRDKFEDVVALLELPHLWGILMGLGLLELSGITAISQWNLSPFFYTASMLYCTLIRLPDISADVPDVFASIVTFHPARKWFKMVIFFVDLFIALKTKTFPYVEFDKSTQWNAGRGQGQSHDAIYASTWEHF